jgi:hypothetical protein
MKIMMLLKMSIIQILTAIRILMKKSHNLLMLLVIYIVRRSKKKFETFQLMEKTEASISFKKREGRKSGKRLESWVHKLTKGNKKNQPIQRGKMVIMPLIKNCKIKLQKVNYTICFILVIQDVSNLCILII